MIQVRSINQIRPLVLSQETFHFKSSTTRENVLFAWAIAALGIGAMLTSYHQPMLASEGKVLSLAEPSSIGKWQAIHVLSGACGCSQVVMRNLLQRGPIEGAVERVILADDDLPYLPGTDLLLKQLGEENFQVIHLQSREVIHDAGLSGVPVLVIVSPRRTVAYLGGYGTRGDQAEHILAKTIAGASGTPLPIFGCAIGERLRREVDPFALKYGAFRNKPSLAVRKVPAV